MEEGRNENAYNIYAEILHAADSAPPKASAVRGMIESRPSTAGRVILKILKGKDSQLQQAVIPLTAEITPETDILVIVAQLPKLQSLQQVQLITALALQKRSSARPAILQSLDSKDQDVRFAAIGALTQLGNVHDVPLLAQIAATSKGQIREAAREVMVRLPRKEVDRAILAIIPTSTTDVQVELIHAVARRQSNGGLVVLLAMAAPENPPDVCSAAFKALRYFPDTDQFEAIVELTLLANDKRVRQEAEKTASALITQSPDQAEMIRYLSIKLTEVESEPNAISLYALLGKIGDRRALDILIAGLDENRSVVTTILRELAEWPDPAPLTNLLGVARSTNDQTHRTLALRGAVRLVQIDSNRSGDDTIRIYREILDLATSDEEVRRVLAGLSHLHSPESIALVLPFVDRETVKEEAQMALLKITEGIWVTIRLMKPGVS